ncbi:MAG: caspase family protein [Geminicoccaceae bacterium]
MSAGPQFSFLDAKRFPELAHLFVKHGSRRISAVHLHHTFIPDKALFDEVSRDLGDSEAAGLELCRRMWRYHTVELGWRDIAQHVTIDPEGRIWLNRSWDLPPASAAGFNGSGLRGPFMIEMIGNFDSGMETPTKPQHEAMLTVIAAVQAAFELEPSALVFHNEMTDKKSCPGNGISKADIVAAVEKRHDKVARGDDEKSGPLGERQTAAFKLLVDLLERDDDVEARGGRSAIELAAELEEGAMRLDTIYRLTDQVGRSQAGSRGALGDAQRLTPAMRRALKPHVINLRQGEFSTRGDFATSAEDAERLVNVDLDRWVKERFSAQETPRVMIYAHGGLTSEASGLVYAFTMLNWWKSIGIYPIFFVWETGIIESVFQLIEDRLGIGRRGFLDDARDALVERVVHELGQPFWEVMKSSARTASEAGATFGAHRLAQLLKGLNEQHGQKIDFHAVGHSAGAIFHNYFMRECTEGNRPLTVNSLHYLAPACTIDLFKSLVKPLVGGRIGNFTLYTMDRLTERNDPTVPVYGKSLLYLVSRGFERVRGEAILGLEDSINEDPDILAFLGLGATHNPDARVIWSPSGDEVPDNSRANATTHGGFDNDQDTMTSVALRILGRNDASTIPDVRQVGDSSRAAGRRLFAPLTSRFTPEVFRELLPESPKPVLGELTAPPTVNTGGGAQAPLLVDSSMRGEGLIAKPGGKRLALCIGINEYKDDAKLSGCVNDANLWGDTLQGMGFQVERLFDTAATHETILQRMGDIVQRAAGGDVVVIQYAGHGAFVDDLSGDEEDGRDEVLVPFDYETPGKLLADDDLWKVLQAGAPETIVTVFMDCCHSGSNSRFAMRRGKARKLSLGHGLMAAHRDRLRLAGARSAAGSKAIENMKHVKFAACTDKEEAFEEDGQGVFTGAAISIVRELMGRSDSVSNRDLEFMIKQRLGNDARQHPKLEARTRDESGPFLGGVLA